MPDTIIIFTQFYPNAHLDYYLEPEVAEISRHFKRVIVVSPLDSAAVRTTPPNAMTLSFNPELKGIKKLFALRHIFSPDFLRETYNIRKILLGKSFIRGWWYACAALEKTNQYLRFLKGVFQREKLEPSAAVIYSQWMLEHAFAAGSMKEEFPGLKVICRAHGSDLYFNRSPISYLPLKRQTFEKANAVYFISEHGKNYFEKFHELSANSILKSRLSRLGVPAPEKSPAEIAGDPPAFRIVSVAFIQPLKRIDLIARALRHIRHLDIEWIHFGDIYEQPGPFEAFKQWAFSLLQSNENIHVQFKGNVAISELHVFYENNLVDLFLNVSTTEGIPVSIMEAFSHGIPALATAVGGIPEIVNESNGVLLPADIDEQSLAGEIAAFLNNDVSARRLFRNNARQTWHQKFNAEKNYREFAADLLQLK